MDYRLLRIMGETILCVKMRYKYEHGKEFYTFTSNRIGGLGETVGFQSRNPASGINKSYLEIDYMRDFF